MVSRVLAFHIFITDSDKFTPGKENYEPSPVCETPDYRQHYFINYRVLYSYFHDIYFYREHRLETAAMSDNIIILAAFSHFPTFQATNI